MSTQLVTSVTTTISVHVFSYQSFLANFKILAVSTKFVRLRICKGSVKADRML